MAYLKCVIYIAVSFFVIIEAIQTPSTTLDIPPEGRLDDDQTFETEPNPSLLRAGLDNYDLFDYTSVPIQDLVKSLLLEHQRPRRLKVPEDVLDFDDSDLLFESPMDNPYIGNTILDNPLLEPPYIGNSLLDSGTLIKGPSIKASPLIKRRPVLKRPLMPLPNTLLPHSVLQNSYKKRQLRDVEQLLKLLLPLINNTGLGMRARLQIGRRSGDTAT